jgi:hypothetical protein
VSDIKLFRIGAGTIDDFGPELLMLDLVAATSVKGSPATAGRNIERRRRRRSARKIQNN